MPLLHISSGACAYMTGCFFAFFFACVYVCDTEKGSQAFDEFLSLLGKRVKMKGFTKYRAQLDNRSEFCLSHFGYGHIPCNEQGIRAVSPPPTFIHAVCFRFKRITTFVCSIFPTYTLLRKTEKMRTVEQKWLGNQALQGQH